MEKDELLGRAREMQPLLSQTRRELHALAETGFRLPKTLEYVKNSLTELGIAHSPCGRAGIKAELGRGQRCILLRADMDALPMAEQSGESFAAESGACHACGHDMHTAMLLGAARLLKEREGALDCRVRLMFQPAEELLEGARDMINSGILDSPRPRAAVMLHVLSGLEQPAGTILLPRGGPAAPAADFFELELQGRGCHGSAPHMGADPISAAAHILLALQGIKARELPPESDAVLSIGLLQSGQSHNAIPSRALMQGSLRAFDEARREFIKNRLEQISLGLAQSLRVDCSLSFSRGCPVLLNDPLFSAWAGKIVGEMPGVSAIPAPEGSSGSEDFAYVSREIPSVMLALCAGDSRKGYVHPLHHPAVRFDEAALPVGAAVLARLALSFPGFGAV